MKDNVREVLAQNNFRFNKRYGQNFITDTNLLEAIVKDSGITDSDTVIEIGTGAGTLTKKLASVAKRVITFEIDENLRAPLARLIGDLDNVSLQFADIMKVKSDELSRLAEGKYKVVANLPYYITTPVVMRFVEDEPDVESITVMVQKEVAARFVAQPGTKDYGAITPSIALVATGEITRMVNRNMFFPVPEVDSALVKIQLVDKGFSHIDTTRKLIKAGFSMRRKTLLNCISDYFKLDKALVIKLLENNGFSPQIRGETLDYVAYDRLASAMIEEGIL